MILFIFILLWSIIGSYIFCATTPNQIYFPLKKSGLIRSRVIILILLCGPMIWFIMVSMYIINFIIKSTDKIEPIIIKIKDWITF
jgi:hypothetical protein